MRKEKIVLGALLLADLALTAAVFIKTCLPTPEERTDREVEDAWGDLEREYGVPVGFDETPVDEPAEDFDAVYERVMAHDDEESSKRDPIDEGIENIMRFSVNGKTGFEQE